MPANSKRAFVAFSDFVNRDSGQRKGRKFVLYSSGTSGNERSDKDSSFISSATFGIATCIRFPKLLCSAFNLKILPSAFNLKIVLMQTWARIAHDCLF